MAMDESSHQYLLPTSHVLGYVPAAIGEDNNVTIHNVPESNLHLFPPNSVHGGGGRGYQSIGTSDGGNGGQQSSNWKGMFNISSYSQYFDVDTDIVVNRLISSLSPNTGDFFNVIDANPDLYGLLWISTTLVLAAASMGNWASYLSARHGGGSWKFDVGYVSTAAWSVYGYSLLVPAAFYFLLRYLGGDPLLVHLWCMWGYSLSYIVLSSLPLLFPVQAVRWVVVALSGGLSSCFVARNLKSYVNRGGGNNMVVLVVVVVSFLIQLAMAVFIKAYFFS